jgi:chorismate synthase
MPANTFGEIFKVTTFGESHGSCIGAIIDGCPAGILLDLDKIQRAVDERKPGINRFVSPRQEEDKVEIVSGLLEKVTTGAPIGILIHNKNYDSAVYKPLEKVYRPGHANFTYLEKYGVYDHKGGGRASARETAVRVAAGAIAMQILEQFSISIEIYLTQVGPYLAQVWDQDDSEIFCPDKAIEEKIKAYLDQLIFEGDSSGGVVTCIIRNAPKGLGEPVFDRFEALLAHAMLSIPATKGFEIGDGFKSAETCGSIFNDQFVNRDDTLSFVTNHAGGTLGGITNGQDIIFKTAFKPTSSIKKSQKTVDFSFKEVELKLDQNAKHDPCVAIRGAVVVKAMAALVTCDLLLRAQTNKITYVHSHKSYS